MTAVAPPSGGQALAQSATDRAGGMISVGGVPIAANDAARLLMMHRTEIMKEVGETRTELAEAHLNDIRRARGYLTDLVSLAEFGKTDTYHGRIPVTPEMISFLKNEVGAAPGERHTRIVFYGSSVSALPETVWRHYGLNLDRFGAYSPQYGGTYDLKNDENSKTDGRYQISGVTVIDDGQIQGLKEELNNYIDQLNDSNNLFMTKFKNVVNTMNEALESANSMEQKEHETIKALVSKW